MTHNLKTLHLFVYKKRNKGKDAWSENSALVCTTPQVNKDGPEQEVAGLQVLVSVVLDAGPGT